MSAKQVFAICVYWQKKGDKKRKADGKKIFPISFGDDKDLVIADAFFWLDDNGISMSENNIMFTYGELVDGKLIHEQKIGDIAAKEYGNAYYLKRVDPTKITTI